MEERLETILKKYNEIQEELMKPEVMADFKLVNNLSKEQSNLKEIVDKYTEYKNIKQEIEEAKSLLNDADLHEMAEAELINLEEEYKKIEQELEILLIPKDENDGKNVIMEIRGAAGGDEANIFAGDLFRMYNYYAERNN